MYGTIAKVAVPGDIGAFLLILGILTLPTALIAIAVMSSVSEFIGFLVITVLPSQTSGQLRQPGYRHKGGDSLIVSDEDSRNDTASDDDAASLTSCSRSQPLSTPVVAHRVKSAERPRNSALATPDFWMIAFIMSMRISLPYIRI